MTIVVARTVRGMNTAALSQNQSINEDSVAKIVLGTNTVGSNLAMTSDGAKTALGMSTVVSNQSPTADGAEDGKAITVAAKATCHAKVVAMKIAARMTTVIAGGKGVATGVAVLAMITMTVPTNDPWSGSHRWVRGAGLIAVNAKSGNPREGMANARIEAAKWESVRAPHMRAIGAVSDSKAVRAVVGNSPTMSAVVRRAIGGRTNASRKT